MQLSSVRSSIHCSVHIRLFFPDPNPPLEQVQLEKLPVILKLKECFTQGGRNRDTGLANGDLENYAFFDLMCSGDIQVAGFCCHCFWKHCKVRMPNHAP